MAKKQHAATQTGSEPTLEFTASIPATKADETAFALVNGATAGAMGLTLGRDDAGVYVYKSGVARSASYEVADQIPAAVVQFVASARKRGAISQ